TGGDRLADLQARFAARPGSMTGVRGESPGAFHQHITLRTGSTWLPRYSQRGSREALLVHRSQTSLGPAKSLLCPRSCGDALWFAEPLADSAAPRRTHPAVPPV